MPTESPGLYADAQMYDILHGPGTKDEVDGLERIASEAFGQDRGRLVWLEPACGTGRYLAELARRGHHVIGFDRNPGMVSFARERLRPFQRKRAVRVFGAELTSFAAKVKPSSVDVVFIPINTVRHLESDAAMLRHFGHVRRVLRPGGVYIVGVGLSWYGYETPTEDVWEGEKRGTHVKQIIEFIPARNARERKEWAYSHLVIRRTGRARVTEEHRDSSYWLRTYSRGQWRALLRKSRLKLHGVVDQRGETTDPGPIGYALYVLRKPLTPR